MQEDALSHVDNVGKLRMVDVSAKEPTVRTARARCVVTADVGSPELNDVIDGSHIQSARLTGIQAAKRTAQIIPLCHPLALDNVQLDIVARAHGWELTSAVTTVGRTGVEMEALTACAYGAVSLLAHLAARGYVARTSGLVVTSKVGGKHDWNLATE